MKNECLKFLPQRLIEEIQKSMQNGSYLEEIRIRRNKNAYLIISGINVRLNIIINDEEIEEILRGITHNSLYAYRDTIKNGYIILENGVRVGIVGTASVENEQIIGVYQINELAFRLPNEIIVNIEEIIDISRNNSILFYSPPGVGKTTLLRSLIKSLSRGKNGMRVGVIDSRGELSYGMNDKNAFVCILVGYPKKIGIEIAVRTMNSQIIICDEIGDESESLSIINAQGAGVPIIATCHGSSIKDIFSHSGIINLHRHHIFDYYVGIKRGPNLDYIFTFSTWSEANDLI